MQDDETTLIEAEAMNDEQDNANEIDKLQQESEIPVEQLRAMYAGLQDMSDSEGDDGDDDAEDDEDVENIRENEKDDCTDCDIDTGNIMESFESSSKQGEPEESDGLENALLRLEKADAVARSIRVWYCLLICTRVIVLPHRWRFLLYYQRN